MNVTTAMAPPQVSMQPRPQQMMQAGLGQMYTPQHLGYLQDPSFMRSQLPDPRQEYRQNIPEGAPRGQGAGQESMGPPSSRKSHNPDSNRSTATTKLDGSEKRQGDSHSSEDMSDSDHEEQATDKARNDQGRKPRGIRKGGKNRGSTEKTSRRPGIGTRLHGGKVAPERGPGLERPNDGDE